MNKKHTFKRKGALEWPLALTLALCVTFVVMSSVANAQSQLRYDIRVREGEFDGLKLTSPRSIPVFCDDNGIARRVKLCGTEVLQVGFRVVATLPSINDIFVNVGDEFKLDKDGALLLGKVPSLIRLRWLGPDEVMASSDWTKLAVPPHLGYLKLIDAQFPIATLRSMARQKAAFSNIEVELYGVAQPDPALKEKVDAAIDECRKVFGSTRAKIMPDGGSRWKLVISPTEKSAEN